MLIVAIARHTAYKAHVAQAFPADFGAGQHVLYLFGKPYQRGGSELHAFVSVPQVQRPNSGLR